MAYTALYRKYRPASFSEVKGQDAVVQALSNQVKTGRVGHAYLFCGTRGTGKTTVAKLMARAVNCEHPQEDGSPCGECESCRAIADGSSMNVIEIDAASNNGVDNIREIREEVAYSPAKGRYKVYIIDEVHMLSIGAFNALLKTLEEPPSYAVFILATTEVHKIPVTILSRCQRYDFRRITVDTIAGRLMDIVSREEVAAEDRALRYIAGAADGSMRDALSIMDQCIAYYPDEPVTYDHVLEILGAVDVTVFGAIFDGIAGHDVDTCLKLLDEMVSQGRELSQFTVDFTWFLRNLLLIKSSDKPELLLEVTTENLAVLKKKAEIADTEQLFRLIRIFSELGSSIRLSGQKRILVEVALIKLCRPQMEEKQDSLAERVRILENDAEQMKSMLASAPKRTTVPQDAQTHPAAASPSAKPELPMAVPDDIGKVVRYFRSWIPDMEPLWRTYMQNVHLSLSKSGALLMVFASEIDKCSMERRLPQLEEYISSKAGKQIRVELASLKNNEQFEDVFVNIENKIKMPVEIADEPDMI